MHTVQKPSTFNVNGRIPWTRGSGENLENKWLFKSLRTLLLLQNEPGSIRKHVLRCFMIIFSHIFHIISVFYRHKMLKVTEKDLRV